MRKALVTPGPVLFCAALGFLFLGAGAFFSETSSLVCLLAGMIALPLIILDLLALLLLTDRSRVERSMAGVLALGVKSPVTLTIRRGGGGLLPGGLRLFDLYPDGMEALSLPAGGDAFPAKISVSALREPAAGGPGDKAVRFTYEVLPLERGNWEFPETQLMLRSFLGCWRLKVIHPLVSRGRTFPDFKKLARGAGNLKAALERSETGGVRKRGQGMEFMGLREYQKGDSVKAIDWRATGRRGRVIVREYEEERDQQILFLLDSGYRLHRREGAGTQFDSALEGATLLSWVALKRGDSVAFGSFGAEERWLPPRKGIGALPGIMRGLYDLKSESVPSSLFSALEGALTRLKRRSLIIMISNFREEDGESLSWIIGNVRRRHLLLLVSLRETEAEAIAARNPAGKDEELETAAARAYLAARKKLYTIWEHSGILTLECSAANLSPALIGRYLEIKRGGLL
ncbi:MAG: DUF58 domain-containing protein [Treponema sp.]|jgi:uncharacterized protein (DUF58 family)|nr:DUF58 domain-containing protein [Treponema sp.]